MFGTRPLFASPVHQGGPGKNVPQPPPNTPVQDQLSAGKKGVPVRYLRNVGAGRNVPVPVLLGGVTAFMAYGWWNYGTSVIADRSAFSPFCRLSSGFSQRREPGRMGEGGGLLTVAACAQRGEGGGAFSTGGHHPLPAGGAGLPVHFAGG